MSLKLRILLILKSLLLALTFTLKSTTVEHYKQTGLYDKRDDFTIPIVNFPFISSDIPASPAAYGVYISQIVRYIIHVIY